MDFGGFVGESRGRFVRKAVVRKGRPACESYVLSQGSDEPPQNDLANPDSVVSAQSPGKLSTSAIVCASVRQKQTFT